MFSLMCVCVCVLESGRLCFAAPVRHLVAVNVVMSCHLLNVLRNVDVEDASENRLKTRLSAFLRFHVWSQTVFFVVH